MRLKGLLSLVLVIVVFALVGCAPAPGQIVTAAQAAQQVAVMPSLATTTAGASIWLGLLFLALGIGGAVWALSSNARHKVILAVASIVSAIVVMLTVGSIVTVDQGEIGVLVRMGRAVEIRHPGVNWITPYVEHVVLLSTRDWTYVTMSDPIAKGNEDYRDYPVDLITKDGVQAAVKYTVQGRLNPEDAMIIYARYGTLENAITQAVKTPSRVIVRQRLQAFTAEELYQQVDTVDSAVMEELGPTMAEAGLSLGMFGFRKPTLGIGGDFETQLNAALVAEQAAKVAQQNIAVKEAEARQKVATANGDKDVSIKSAEGRAASTLAEQKANADAALYTAQQQAAQTRVAADAQAYKTLTEAKAQADANQQLAASVTDRLTEYVRWSRWDGKLPQWVSDMSRLFVTTPAPTAPPAK